MKEPEYQRRCSYCGVPVEESQQCCGEVHNQMEPECPECGDEITWSHGVTGDGTEYSIPKCVNCDWEGDPQ